VKRTKLVIIEGVPGSGKTSTARFAADWLREHGFEARLHLEGDLEHPADFESVACLSAAAYSELLEGFSAWRGALAALAELASSSQPDKQSEVFISYRKLAEPPAELFAALARQDVYELPAADFQHVTLERWQAFARAAAEDPAAYVFECCFLQNQLTSLLAVHNLDQAAIAAQVAQISQAVLPLNPLLIYLEPVSIRATLEQAVRERPREWLDFVVQYTCGQAWGKSRGLDGFEGMLRFYETRRDLEKQLFPALCADRLWLEQADLDWNSTQARFAQFLAERAG
jgi:hypothetical protein